MINRYYVYQLRLENKPLPFYIGKGTGNRAYMHLKGTDGKNAHKNRLIQKAIREGVEVCVEFLWTDLSEDEAHRREVWAIKIHGRHDLKEGILTNRSDGGEGHKNPIYKKRPPRTEEHKEKLRQANLGKKASPESLAKMSKVHKGVKKSPEHIAKMVQSHTGAKRSQTAKDNMKLHLDNLNSQKITCEHCGKCVNKGAYGHWHGDKCKSIKLVFTDLFNIQ